MTTQLKPNITCKITTSLVPYLHDLQSSLDTSTSLINKTVLLMTLLSQVILGFTQSLTFDPINTENGLSDNQVRYILQLADGRLMFTTSGTVNIYDGTGFRYIHRQENHISPLSGYDGHYRIYQTADTLLWIKDQHKLMCIDMNLELYVSNPQRLLMGKDRKLTVLDLFCDHDDRTWLLTPKGLQLHQQELILDVRPFGKIQDVGSMEEELFAFFDNGQVVCYDLETGKPKYVNAAYPKQDIDLYAKTSLVVKGENAFYQLRNGTRGGFFSFDIKHGSWNQLLETSYTLNTLIINKNQQAYISTVQGLWTFDLINQTKKYLPSLKVQDANNVNAHISTIFMDKQEGLWVGTFNRGLLYHHPDRYEIQKVTLPKSMEGQSSNVESIAELASADLLIKSGKNYYQVSVKDIEKTEYSVQLIDLPDKKLISKFPGKNQQNKFNNRIYNDLLEDSRGWQWGATTDGLDLYTSKTQEPKRFYTEHGLTNNYIHAILEDDNSNIWVSTSNGISKLSIQDMSDEPKISRYNKFNGALAGEYLRGSALKGKDGKLIFGGINGFNIIDPNKANTTELPFKPVLTSIKLHGETVRTAEAYGDQIILEKSPSKTQKIYLNHDQNTLTFEFSALNYINPEQTYYRYQMKGLSDKWIEVHPEIGSNGLLRINYSGLNPGSYLLGVKATNKPTDWIYESKQIYITINPPWWKTTNAYVLYVFSSICLIAAASYIHQKNLKSQLNQKHREEILLLRIKNLLDQLGSAPPKTSDQTEESSKILEPELHPSDKKFLNKAITLVEQNLNQPGYSVEQLSIDLCMERSGLYKRLKIILDESPSFFIRNIRLRKAAEMILTDEHSISEISHLVGFSSPSYFSKCFLETYGCKPSEYTIKIKNQPN